ncbi:MAG: hypothetical protein GY757_46875 [bacterium]|nr:hypothetical protein [bacterium]
MNEPYQNKTGSNPQEHDAFHDLIINDKIKPILQKLAFRNHCHHRQSMTEKEIRAEIAESTSSPDRENGAPSTNLPYSSLYDLILQSRVLEQTAPHTYRFRHMAIQEYYTARELIERKDSLTAITQHISDPWWEASILLYAEQIENASPLIRQILVESPEDIFYSNLILSGKCIAHAHYIHPLLEEEIIRRLWKLYNTAKYPLLKEKTIAILALLKPLQVIGESINRLTDKEPKVQQQAAETLGLMGAAEAIPSLIMLLVKDGDPKNRSSAARALGQIPGHGTQAALIEVLNHDKEQEVRISAAEALGESGRPEALPALFNILALEENDNIRGAAAGAIGKQASKQAIPRLVRALDEEKSPTVRWRIVKSLEKCGHNAPNIHRLLIDTLSVDKDKEVRESAAEALGAIGSAESVISLVKALESDEDKEVRGSAAYGLGLTGSSQALPILIQALVSDSDVEVRARAAFALGSIKKPEALPFLTFALATQTEPLLRGNATHAIGTIGGIETLPFLIFTLNMEKNPYSRYRAAEVLGEFGDLSTIPPLKTALEDDGKYHGWKVKDKAFEALEKISRRLQMKLFKDATGGPATRGWADPGALRGPKPFSRTPTG